MKIKFKRLSERAVMPIRATKGSSGYDLVCTDVTTELSECGQLVLVYHTGLAVEIPEGYEGQIRPRSSISKKSLRMCNAPGTVDSDYRGEITVKFMSTTDVVPAVYKPGERFAQMIIARSEDVEFIESEELSDTERGDNGYGSTGDISAPKGSEGSPEVKSELTNQQDTNTGSGGTKRSAKKAK